MDVWKVCVKKDVRFMNQTQVSSVDPGVIVLHLARSDCCGYSQEYLESVNPGICEV